MVYHPRDGREEKHKEGNSRQERSLSDVSDTMRCAILNNTTRPCCLPESTSQRRVVVQTIQQWEDERTRKNGGRVRLEYVLVIEQNRGGAKALQQ